MKNELDDQALSLANLYIKQIASEVEAAVEHVTRRGKNLEGTKELDFRNTVGTMQMRAHLFAALTVIRHSGMPDEEVIRYVADSINTLVEAGNVNEAKVH